MCKENRRICLSNLSPRSHIRGDAVSIYSFESIDQTRKIKVVLKESVDIRKAEWYYLLINIKEYGFTMIVLEDCDCSAGKT
ncbi:hypothetical protein BPJM79_170007 [Bacillus pumilus]